MDRLDTHTTPGGTRYTRLAHTLDYALYEITHTPPRGVRYEVLLVTRTGLRGWLFPTRAAAEAHLRARGVVLRP